MTIIMNHPEIMSIVKHIDIISEIETGFIEFSQGNVVVPPVGELLFDEPKGEVHIKYGFIKHSDLYCIKIASGFQDNSKFGVESNQGLMLLFNQNTGVPEVILLDNGALTDHRTAAAGALVAKHFAPTNIEAIGIIGTGVQARMQLEYLKKVVNCDTVWIWGRSRGKAEQYQKEMSSFNIKIAKDPAELARYSNLIVTTTASDSALLFAEDVRPGTLITAVGSDTAFKQELHSKLLAKATLILSDSLAQSKSRGEIYQATKAGQISAENVQELGNQIQIPQQAVRATDITIADLTGVAIQDIMIAKAVFKGYRNIKDVNGD